MKTVKIKRYNIFSGDLKNINFQANQKLVINTINAHSYIVANNDYDFEKALVASDILLPDGEGIVYMTKYIKGENINKIAGADIHSHLLEQANEKKLKCFYMGASEETLKIIKGKQEKSYPNVKFGFFSPPFKKVFSDSDNAIMIEKINIFSPDILFVGMTAPKQEKWVDENSENINANIICSIGAVFDFVAGTKKRAPNWMIKLKLEWLHRAFSSWRLTKRYLYSNPLFLIEILRLRLAKTKSYEN